MDSRTQVRKKWKALTNFIRLTQSSFTLASFKMSAIQDFSMTQNLPNNISSDFLYSLGGSGKHGLVLPPSVPENHQQFCVLKFRGIENFDMTQYLHEKLSQSLCTDEG